MEIAQLETESAIPQWEYLVRAQIRRKMSHACWPPSLPCATAAMRGSPRSCGGTLQFKALEGSKEGESQLYELPSEEISISVPGD